MKLNVYCLLAFLFFKLDLIVDAQIIEPAVDQRIEVISIAFRLADSEEYLTASYPEYNLKVEAHFRKHENHSLIKYIKKIRKRYGIGYDAPMFMAVHLSQPPALQPLIPLKEGTPEKRWNEKTSRKFLNLLRSFYADTEFADFYAMNEPLYQESIARFRKLANMLDLSWYEKFYGAKVDGSFQVIVGPGNGGGNYGPKVIYPEGNEDLYAVMGVWSVDDAGKPVFDMNHYFPTLIHEFNHSFVNHLVSQYENDFQESGSLLFEKVAKQMDEQGYSNWKSVIIESIVRAAVIKYIKDAKFGKEVQQRATMEELDRGFIWTRELVTEFDRYEQERNVHQEFESFVPALVLFFEEVASKYEELKSELNKKRPEVTGITPSLANNRVISPATKEIEVHFSMPLAGKGYSYRKGEMGEDGVPSINKIRYSDDRKRVIFEVDLEPKKSYQMVLLGLSFKTNEGFGIENYHLEFSTSE